MKDEKTDFLGISSGSRDGAAALLRHGERDALRIERRLLQRLAGSMGDPPLLIRLWDGSEIRLGGRAPVDVGITIRDRGALWRMLLHPELYFGDDYSTGRIEVNGDLVQFLETLFLSRPPLASDGFMEQLRNRFSRASCNTMAGSRQNIQHHYDLSNDFYSLWLDERMQYTCAYFATPEASLAEAQVAKLDHVCRKLRLKPGETVFEAGCGWGGLARHMARHYDVKVRAFNISREQLRYARARAREEGVEDRVEYVEDDYRNITGTCDAFVSVGMLEHVGVEHYRELGEVVNRCLREDGRGLIHSIGKNRARPMTPWIERRIFPGAYPPTLGQMMEIFEPREFSVLDVENLRLHYARTLDGWLERFEARQDEIERMFDRSFVRAWRFYLASSLASFSTGSLQLFQVLFTRPRNNAIPWTRAHLYREGI
ncbi:SAM-dependent methyltransferase [Thiohalomonas denitrificans]|uniref:SAM-dependent methyltransferase n=1 Tax=Thiohalomonas denitrificans TaxID=415747 RepID=UPI0026EE5E5B|nr:cyclopropane-fatty-acyl-phospholipid synthase family protein [Thiohalomonas denitrificans]